MSFSVIGQVVHVGDAKLGRVEVAVATGRAYEDEGVPSPVIFVSKYRAGQLGERSIGLSVVEARAIARLLVEAADSCMPSIIKAVA